jgi:hypothetical protein
VIDNKLHREELLILAHDPGKTNFGFSLIRCGRTSSGVAVEVLRCGILEHTIASFNRIEDQIAAFQEHSLNVLEREFGPIDVYVVERFQSRGLKTSLLEIVNVGIGAMLHNLYTRTARVRLITTTASGWKNSANLFFDLKGAYKRIRVTPHEFDATLIGIYAACKIYDIKPYNWLSNRKIGLIHSMCVRATTGKLRNRRCTSAR